MTEEEIKQLAEKNASTYSELDEWQRVKEAYIKGATEATKDLQSQLTEKDKQIEELKKEIDYAKEHCLFSDCERVKRLEAQIEKMKACCNCYWSDYLTNGHCIDCKNYCNWKLKE